MSGNYQPLAQCGPQLSVEREAYGFFEEREIGVNEVVLAHVLRATGKHALYVRSSSLEDEPPLMYFPDGRREQLLTDGMGPWAYARFEKSPGLEAIETRLSVGFDPIRVLAIAASDVEELWEPHSRSFEAGQQLAENEGMLVVEGINHALAQLMRDICLLQTARRRMQAKHDLAGATVAALAVFLYGMHPEGAIQTTTAVTASGFMLGGAVWTNALAALCPSPPHEPCELLGPLTSKA